MAWALSLEPTAPTLIAATGMSCSTARAWSSTHSSSITSASSTPRVSCTATAVTAQARWHPIAAQVTASASTPPAPVGSDTENDNTAGGG